VQIVRDVAALRAAIAELRSNGGAVALVPTMGALHAGHMALVEEARRRAAHVVASIFVNPKQFGATEDLATYPRQEAADAAMLEQAGCILLWAPTVDAMYPEGFATNVSVAGVSEGLCGAARPGHFDGVATVVAKLFNQIRPEIALFGEKDYQQLAVIRRLAADLDLPIEVVGVPTRRDADGLALSSRNFYLSPAERKAAAALPQALLAAAEAIAGGGEIDAALAQVRTRLEAAGFIPEYVELRDADSLASIARLDAPARLLAAARLGRTRLIDNVAVAPSPIPSPPR
jgi:pantoate--beta-alanine ligase